MEYNLYNRINKNQFKDIKFSIYNKIADEYIPQQWGKKDNAVYSVDDFEYYELNLDKKEKFLITMYNKEIRNSIQEVIDKFKDKRIIVDVDYKNGDINIIKLKNEEF